MTSVRTVYGVVVMALAVLCFALSGVAGARGP